jgi:hypothetical protein
MHVALPLSKSIASHSKSLYWGFGCCPHLYILFRTSVTFAGELFQTGHLCYHCLTGSNRAVAYAVAGSNTACYGLPYPDYEQGTEKSDECRPILVIKQAPVRPAAGSKMAAAPEWSDYWQMEQVHGE